MGQVERLTYRVPDLARLLGCSELAARRMVDRGQVPARRWGRRIVILADELHARLQELPARRQGQTAIAPPQGGTA
jgi:excisionase family DNA binding protein